MSTVASKTAVVIAGRFLTRATQLVFFVVLARSLSPSGFGAYGVITSAIFLTSVIGTLGLRQSSAQMIGQGALSDGAAATTAFLCWPILTLGCCAGLWWSNREQLAALGIVEVYAVWVGVGAILFITLAQGVFLGRSEIKTFAMTDTAPRLIQGILVILLWLAGALTLTTALVSFAVAFLLMLPWVVRRVYRNVKSARPRIDMLLPLARTGFVYALSLFLISMQGRVGLFFLSGIDAEQQTGHFFAAQRASEIFLDVATATTVVLFSETARSKDPQAAFIAATRTAVGLFAIFLVIGVFVAICAPLLVMVVLGRGYAGSQDALFVLGLGLAPVAAARIMNGVVAGMGRPWISALVAAAGLSVNFAVCSMAAARWGAVGASVALVAGQTASCFGYIVVGRMLFGVSAREVVPSFSQAQQRILTRLRNRERR